MKLCMMILSNSAIATITLARCALSPGIDGPPAAHFHGEWPWHSRSSEWAPRRDLARSRLIPTTTQVYHKVL